jgi:hypothetical protein
MARRRKGLVEILFPELHRAYRKAKHDMRPDRAAGRVLSIPEIKAGLRTSTRTSAASRKKQIAKGKVVPTKKTAAKKTTKAADPYAAALGIPAQNRAAAAGQAKSAQSAKKAAAPRTAKAASTPVPVRNPDGTFNGSRSVPTFGPAEQERNRQAWTGYVDPALRVRNSRTRRG